MTKITFQGAKGAFSYQACKEYFNEGEYIGCETFDKAIKMVENDEADFAMIPVENSTAGRVMEVYHLLPDCKLYVVGEHLLPIHHCLMVPKKAADKGEEQAIKEIKEIHSHPQGLAQCWGFLNKNFPDAKQKAVWDTAGAAKDIADRDDAEIAAIAPSAAASVYNMEILRENIEDRKGNTTRFLILSKTPSEVVKTHDNVLITIIFETSHKPGSLVNVLQIFEKYGMNMTKLESYMVGRTDHIPRFYVDLFMGKDVDLTQFNKELDQAVKGKRILGIYPPSEKRGQEDIFFFGF